MHAEGAGAAKLPYCFFGKTPRKTGGDLLAECAKKDDWRASRATFRLARGQNVYGGHRR